MRVPDRRTMLVATVAAASVIGSGIALYVLLQRAPTATPVTSAASAPATMAAAEANARPLDQMADRLAARLAKEGGSAADWALLGRSYREMARWPDAVRAFERSLALAPDAQVQADLDAARAKAAAR